MNGVQPLDYVFQANAEKEEAISRLHTFLQSDIAGMRYAVHGRCTCLVCVR